MKECFKCGISEELANMHDAITSEGIKPLCSRCLSDENLPIIRKPTSNQIEESKKQETVKEKMQRASGKRFFKGSVAKEGRSYRDIIEDKIGKDYSKFPKKREDLIENFHWKIMNARRRNKLTLIELGRKINENPETIKKAERGHLPSNEKEFLRKLEQFLRISLFKKQENQYFENNSLRKKEEENSNKNNLTIGDVKKVHENNKIQEPEKTSQKSELIQRFKRKFNLDKTPEQEKINEDELREKIQETMKNRVKENYSEEDKEKLKSEIKKSLEKSGERIWKRPEEIKKNKEDLTDDEIEDILFRK